MEIKNIFNVNKINSLRTLICIRTSKYHNTNKFFEGISFYPTLEKFYFNKPVLSFFIFINYFDDSASFKIKGLEICCLPHNNVVKEDFNSDIIQNFKTYKYLKEGQAQKYDSYYNPVNSPRDCWKEFNINQKKYYYDEKMPHPFDSKKILVWSYIANKWHVLIGGHTIRIRKELIKNRKDDGNNYWEGWLKINL